MYSIVYFVLTVNIILLNQVVLRYHIKNLNSSVEVREVVLDHHLY